MVVVRNEGLRGRPGGLPKGSTDSPIKKCRSQEKVNFVGVSSLGGAHLTLGEMLLTLARKKEIIDNTVLTIGGEFSPNDTEKLKSLGFHCVFMPGVREKEVVSTIRGALDTKLAKAMVR
jgi:methylmalonyl-CoA mutase C-terminal domain/subunit